MKIRAVRLREVGCFSQPVEVNGFTGALDVLAGPNELGKSTLLKALRYLFTYGHTTQAKDIEGLRPYAGGSPLIEVDFEVGHHVWRLRKQYLNDRQALLTDVGTGNVVARGEDAHKRALELIGGDQQLGLLWVKQGGSLQHTVPSDAARERLSQVIEREIQSAAGGQEARVVRAQVEQQRRALVTEKTAKPTGDYKKAIVERDTAAQALEAARAVARQSAERIDRMQALKQRFAQLNDPATIASQREAIETLTRSRDDALAARQRLRLADTEAKACESRRSQAGQAHDLFTQQLAQLRELAAEVSNCADAERAAAVSLDSLGQRLAEVRSRRDDLRAKLEAQQSTLKRREAADRQRAAARRLEQVNQLLAQVRSLVERIDQIEAQLAEDPVTDRLFKAADNEARAVAQLEARIAAQLPKVHIAYSAGGAGRIKVAGHSLADGQTLSPSRPVVIEIEGIGTITVDPALSESAEHDQSDLDAHRAELTAKLAVAGVDDIEMLRHRLEARRSLERELQQAKDGIATRAPMGIDALVAEERRLLELVETQPVPEDLPDPREIETAISELTAQHRTTEQELEAATLGHANTGKVLAGAIARRQSMEAQSAALAGVLPPEADRPRRLEELAAQLSIAEDAVATALRTRDAWAEKALDEPQMRDLEMRLAEAVRAERASKEEINAIERDMAVVARDLERDWQDGVESRVLVLEQGFTQWRNRVDQFERDLAALNVLLGVLDQGEAQSRARYLSPVMKRFETYAGLVFPGAAISMKADLSIESFERGSALERLNALSDGTQEQIAVLARLAFAQLLADAGQPGPLILDDALVYSDDVRLEALFSALQTASLAHQVVVLTCRARSFERLGGSRLTLTPWRVS